VCVCVCSPARTCARACACVHTCTHIHVHTLPVLYLASMLELEGEVCDVLRGLLKFSFAVARYVL